MDNDKSRHKHIVKEYDMELERLSSLMMQMGELAYLQVELSVESVVMRDDAIASQVIKGDAAIDELAASIQALAFETLLLRQPTSIDLRLVISILKNSTSLERIGDYASNIAKRALVLNAKDSTEAAVAIPRMSRLVLRRVREVLDSFKQRDDARALQVWYGDEEVDEKYISLLREILTYMMEDPAKITPCTHVLFIIRNLERIGDHATNIANNIYFLINGAPPSGKRPKPRHWEQ